MTIVREKFEFMVPENLNEDSLAGKWASERSARTKKGCPGREGRAGGDYDSRYVNNTTFYGGLPPGSNSPDAEMSDERVMRTVTAGTDDVTDNPKGRDFVRGYVELDMSPTDDNEQRKDLFYSDVTVDGDTGYLERGNVLDRT